MTIQRMPGKAKPKAKGTAHASKPRKSAIKSIRDLGGWRSGRTTTFMAVGLVFLKLLASQRTIALRSMNSLLKRMPLSPLD